MESGMLSHLAELFGGFENTEIVELFSSLAGSNTPPSPSRRGWQSVGQRHLKSTEHDNSRPQPHEVLSEDPSVDCRSLSQGTGVWCGLLLYC